MNYYDLISLILTQLHEQINSDEFLEWFRRPNFFVRYRKLTLKQVVAYLIHSKNVPWILNCLIFSASFRTLIFLMFPDRLFQKSEKEFCLIFSKNFLMNRLKWFIHTLTVPKTGLDTVFCR